MIRLQKLNKNDIIICLLTFCVLMLIFNYAKIYKLNFCEIDTTGEKIKFNNEFLEKFAINYEKLKDMLNSTKNYMSNNKNEFEKPFVEIGSLALSQIIKPMSNETFMHDVKPKIKISKERESLISIGIPTIKRHNVSYLKQTLDSLFYSMNTEEKKLVLIVVFIAEVFIFYFF